KIEIIDKRRQSRSSLCRMSAASRAVPYTHPKSFGNMGPTRYPLGPALIEGEARLQELQRPGRERASAMATRCAESPWPASGFVNLSVGTTIVERERPWC